MIRPWERYKPDQKEIKDTKIRQEFVESNQAKVDALQHTAETLIRRNHLGENIHKALGG